MTTDWVGRMSAPNGDQFWPDDLWEAQYFRFQYGAEFEGACPGRELRPNPCTCTCWGCKHHCGACWRPS